MEVSYEEGSEWRRGGGDHGRRGGGDCCEEGWRGEVT